MMRTVLFFLCLSLFAVPLFSDEGDFNSALNSTAYRGDVEAVRSLLEAGANPRGRNSKGRTVCYDATKVTVLELLAAHGARFDTIDDKEMSPIMQYLWDGKTAEAQFAFDWEQQYSPRFSAGFISRKDYCTELLSRLASGSWRNREAGIPLAKKLLDAGADPAAKDSKGVPIVCKASRRDETGLAVLLVERGAPVDGFDGDDRTPLMNAANNRYSEDLVEFLLAHGADSNQRNSSGETALMYAETVTAAAALLAHGADLNLQNNEGETALIRTRFYPDVQRLLLRAGADPTIKDAKGRTAMHLWVYKADMPLLDDLLAAGCPLDDPDIDGITPLMQVVSGSHEDDIPAILALLAKGADPSKSRDYEGKSIFHAYVARIFSGGKEAKPVVAAFLAAGARPADTDKKGNSALIHLLYESRLYPDMKPLRDMALKYASAAERKAAKAKVAKMRGDNFSNSLSDDGALLAKVLAAFLLITGLSILMREKVFAKHISSNIMGIVNSFLTLCAIGLFFGFVIGGRSHKGSGAWADMFGPVLYGTFWGIIGLFGGFIVACLPPVLKAFMRYRGLYYLPALLSTVILVITLYHVFWFV